MALVLPLFALFMVMTIDFGRVFFSYIQITNAAREAAAYGASVPADGLGITARANQEKNAQSQGGETAINVTWACSDPGGSTIPCASAAGGTGAGNRMTVTVTEPFTFLTPLVDSLLGSFSLRADATSNVLGYAAGSGAGGSGACTTPPTASFTVVVLEDLTVQTDPSGSTPDSGICNIAGFNWTWGDGTSGPGSATGETHTYLGANTYTIGLEVTNPAGTATTTQQVTVPEGAPIDCLPPDASFTISYSSNKKIHTYRDTSTVDDDDNCFIASWEWTFGNGIQSNAPNPFPVDYGNDGRERHSTTLKVTNAGGTDSVTTSHQP